jgi:DNA-binding transcriptional LysR family regulator
VELRQVRYFITVAEELHFGRAAERLLIVQSAVSQQIRRLERELGADLFDRSSRHVRLTEAGEAFLAPARRILEAEREAVAAVARLGPVRETRLRLGTSTGLGAHLDRVLAALADADPLLRFELSSGPADERLARVAAGELDAAFVRGVEEGPAGVRLLPVWRDELVVALPAGHPAARQERVALSALAGLPLYLTARRRNPPLVDLVTDACRDAGFEPLPGPGHSSLQDTLAALGAGAPGWTVVYAAHAEQLATTRVAFRPACGPGLVLPAALAVREGELPRRVRLLLDACRAAGRAGASDLDS